MGGTVSTGEDNDELVDNLVEASYLKTALVEKVFRAVDRAHYYLPDQRDSAYKDLAWKHDRLHLSAPCIYSEVMEALQLEPSVSFLNLGSGTGYLSTMVGLILGPYGVNHGVEQYEDVVEYARARLEEFKANNSSFDEFDFCEPEFVVGNCLQLNSGCQLYDRVYVGAACPPEHENYMKNLIKIGGVLVMPLNERLIQAKRIAETEWEVKNMLPVSFATLVSPNPDVPANLIDLPETHLPILQDLCRTNIRQILRANIHKRNPSLSKVRKRVKKPKKDNFRPIPGMVILRRYGERDSDNDDNDDDDDDERDNEENRDEINHAEENRYDTDKDDDNDEDLEECLAGGDVNNERRNGVGSKKENRGKFGDAMDDEDEDYEMCQEDERVKEVKKGVVLGKNGKRRRSNEGGIIESAEQETGNTLDDNQNVGVKDDGKGEKDEMSDYGSDEEEYFEACDKPRLEKAESSNANATRSSRSAKAELEQILASHIGEMRSIIAREIAGSEAARNRRVNDRPNPPSIPSSDSEDEDMQLNFSEMLKYSPKGSCPPRKQRYSSNTSVDTSTTSGIGSFVDDHLDMEFGHAGSTHSPTNDSIHGFANKSKLGNDMDVDEGDCIESVDEATKESVSTYMKEYVELLPLPPALKSYLLYYRN